MTAQNLVWIFLILCWAIETHARCHPVDDRFFKGVYGPTFVREHKCTNVTYSEVPNYLNQRVHNDAILVIENSDIGYLKRDFFPEARAFYVVTLSMLNCKMELIEKQSISRLKKLYNLTLYNNDLSYFDGSYIFANNMRFQHLNLTKNKIKNIGDICSGLPTLSILILRDNAIENVTRDQFKNCQSVEYLDLSQNPLKHISDDAFGNSPGLVHLVLQNCGLKKLEKMYQNLPNLTWLDLSCNNFTTFDIRLFKYFPSIKLLNLSHNNINLSDTSYAVQGSFGIRQLYLNNNNITYVNISNFKELQSLDLSNNQIETLPVNYFEFCSNLRHLLLQNNKLSTLSIGIFSSLKEIIQIDLSYNRLSNLNTDIFNDIESLEELNLSGNNFFPSLGILHNFYHLKRFFLLDVNVSCSVLTRFLYFCNGKPMTCKDQSKLNFKTTNIQGIPCFADIDQNSTIPKNGYARKAKSYSAKSVAPFADMTADFLKYFNPSSDIQQGQTEIYKEELSVKKISYVIIVLLVISSVLICYEIFFPSIRRRLFKPRRELRPSSNISSMSVLNADYISMD